MNGPRTDADMPPPPAAWLARWVERLFWTGVFLVLAVAPLPLGSVNTEWQMPLAAACLVLGVVGALLLPALRGQPIRLPRALLPLAAIAALAGLQSVPLPRGIVRLVSPGRSSLPPLPGEGGGMPLSVCPGASLESGLLLLGAFYFAWAVAQSRSRAGFRLLMLAGFLHAALAFVLAETEGTTSTRVLFAYDLPEVLSPFGSYANKNHLAGLMLVTAGAAFAILARRFSVALRRSEGLSPGARVAALTGRGFVRLATPLLAAVTMAMAIFASGSRGASVALVVALVTVVFAAGVLRRRFVVLPVVGLLVLVGGAAWVAMQGKSASVLERFVPGGRYMNRPRLWRNTLEMSLSYPVAGTGLGTFALAFPRHQEFAPDRTFSHAESDWVQMAAETGILGLSALVALGYSSLASLAASWRAKGRRRALAAGGAVGLLSVLIHGFGDVSLHIPANLVAFSVLLGGLVGPVGVARANPEEVS